MAKKYYVFYDPRHNDRIMGQSTEKKAMEFPSVKTEEWYLNLQNLEIKFDEQGKPYIYVKNDYKYIKKHN